MLSIQLFSFDSGVIRKLSEFSERVPCRLRTMKLLIANEWNDGMGVSGREVLVYIKGEREG